MVRFMVWALATGFVTGAVWFAIIFFRRGTPDIDALRRLQDEEVARAQRLAEREARRLRAGEVVPTHVVQHADAAERVERRAPPA